MENNKKFALNEEQLDAVTGGTEEQRDALLSYHYPDGGTPGGPVTTEYRVYRCKQCQSVMKVKDENKCMLYNGTFPCSCGKNDWEHVGFDYI